MKIAKEKLIDFLKAFDGEIKVSKKSELNFKDSQKLKELVEKLETIWSDLDEFLDDDYLEKISDVVNGLDTWMESISSFDSENYSKLELLIDKSKMEQLRELDENNELKKK